jgi:uncharacterized protein (DUF58 family)
MIGRPMQNAKSKAPSTSFALPREGLYWLIVSVGLLGIGLFKGINLLLLLACLMLALWLLNVVLAGRRLGRLRGQRFRDGPVFARVPFLVQVQVTNPRSAPVLSVRVEDHGDAHALGWFVPRLEGRQRAEFQQWVTLPERGSYRWGALTASSAYPFGLVRRGRALTPAEEVIVLPALGRLHRGRLRCYLTPVGYYSAPARGSTRRDPTAQAEFHGLRAFRSGDSPRWIHWRTSARCGELMVREFEDVPNDNLVVVVDPELPAGHPSAALDAVISLAATVCWEWCRQKGDFLALVVAGPEPEVIDGVTGPELALRTLECLAVQTGQSSSDADALVECLQTHPLPPAPLLLLGARPSALGDLLAQRLGRPVAALDASALADIDFYEGPPLPAGRGSGKTKR